MNSKDVNKGLMKKKDILHPKLYFKYDVVDQQTQLSYYSNQFNNYYK